MKYLIIALIALGLIGGGYYFFTRNNTTTQQETNNSSNTKVDNNASSEDTSTPKSQDELNFSGVKIANNYYEFNQADFQAAKTANRPIFLFFYANWCPTCAKQDPIVQELMNELKSETQLENLVAFRVNFNDNQTDDTEESLAREFGVSYQHTMFTLDKKGHQIQKLLGQTSKDSLKSAFQKVVEI